MDGVTLRSIVLFVFLLGLGVGFLLYVRTGAPQAPKPVTVPVPVTVAVSATAPVKPATQEAQPATPEAKPAAPEAAPDTAPPEKAADAPTSWTDPRVIAELIKNCEFEASRDRPEWVGELGPGVTNPLMCLSGRDQSCTPDPCFDDADDNGCRARCEKSCDGCTTTCATQCKSCKASCKDDACRLSCATQCGTCQQDCIRAVDRCSTGTCSTEYKACQVRFKDNWEKNGCDRICDKFKKSCTKTCKSQKKEDDEIDSCVYDCLVTKRDKGGERCDLLYCHQ
jgi:hypothetical protein